jgi:hypothetical protein
MTNRHFACKLKRIDTLTPCSANGGLMRLQQNPELRATYSPRKRMSLRHNIYVSNIGTSSSFETPPEMVIVRAPAASSGGLLAFEVPLDIH